MDNKLIAVLREYCKDFAAVSAKTVNADCTTLYSIKNSFDYVRKSVVQYGLDLTNFGGSLLSKAETAANVLVELSDCLQELKNSIEAFCDRQEAANNRS